MARLIKKIKATTRYCACPDSVPRDCRFTSASTCPYGHFPNGRWLWADSFVSIETGETVEPTGDDQIVESVSKLPPQAPAPIVVLDEDADPEDD